LMTFVRQTVTQVHEVPLLAVRSDSGRAADRLLEV